MTKNTYKFLVGVGQWIIRIGIATGIISAISVPFLIYFHRLWWIIGSAVGIVLGAALVASGFYMDAVMALIDDSGQYE